MQSSNYANRVSAIVQKHKRKMKSELTLNNLNRFWKLTGFGKPVKKVSIKIESLSEKIEKGLQELEQYDWENAQRKNATELMKKGMKFAFTLHQLNSFFPVEEQYRQNDKLITTFTEDYSLCVFSSIQEAYSALTEGNENSIKELFD